ncbi:MAG: polysaccharide biosynthesis/export family protein, partial [Novosphingobium sp.]
MVDVTIWEAPPAVLYASAAEMRSLVTTATTRSTTLPEQIIDRSGRLTIPFAGSIVASGKTPHQLEQLITSQLAGKANQPQVMVRLTKNATANVTVVGEVSNSLRVSLSPKGERLLDAIAAAGGVRQPVAKTMVQVTRGDRVVAMPLEKVIKDPSQNIILSADDVITAYYQPYSFTALGAVTRSAEIPFEATGLTLAQALGRIGGLNDDRANAGGVFLFRLEDPAALRGAIPEDAEFTSNGKVPIIYR